MKILKLMLLLWMSSCVNEDGQITNVIAPAEVALPVAVANEILVAGKKTFVKFEIVQDSDCHKAYPVSRLKLEMRSVKGGQTLALVKTIYPSRHKFEEMFILDRNLKYKFILLHDLDQSILAEQTEFLSKNSNVRLKIKCSQN